LDNKDRRTLLYLLVKTNKRYNWLCHAYCLMDNHYHLLIETPDGNLSKGMRQLNGVYTQYFNYIHERVGHLFQGRYKAILIQKDSHLLEACRYVVLNPVRAKSVERAEFWQWSSFQATAGKERPHPCLTVDWILAQFGRDRDTAQKRYEAFVNAGIGVGSIWKGIKGQMVLGEDSFVNKFIAPLKINEENKEIPKSQRLLNRPILAVLFKEEIMHIKQQRNKTIIEAVEKYGYSQKEVADFLGMHYTTISRLMVGKYKC